MVDAAVSKTAEGNLVRVRLPLPARWCCRSSTSTVLRRLVPWHLPTLRAHAGRGAGTHRPTHRNRQPSCPRGPPLTARPRALRDRRNRRRWPEGGYDLHGHAAGDALLSGLATAMVQELRPSDVLVRTGGDEFVAVLIDCDAQGAVRFGSRLQRAVLQVAFTWGCRASSSARRPARPEAPRPTSQAQQITRSTLPKRQRMHVAIWPQALGISPTRALGASRLAA